MKTVTTLTLTAIASLALAGTASANDNTFTATLSFDANAPVESVYTQIKDSATQVCIAEARDGGFKNAHAKSFQVRRCARDLVSQVVRSADNDKLAAYHEFTINPQTRTIQLADAK